MEWFNELATRLHGALPFGGAGAVVAVAMIFALRLLLPYSQGHLIRWPSRLLFAHLVFVVLAAVSEVGSGLHDFAGHAAFLLILISLSRAGFILAIDWLLARRLHRPIPKIFRDILEGLVYTAAVLAVLRHAGAEIDALLTTSALLTAVIGLSLQDTLGNVFAGLSLQAQNPFEVGDWIQYNDDQEMVGRVVEINWRATRVITLDQNEIVIPNGPIAKAAIRNFSKPTTLGRRSLYVVVPREVAPHRVRAAIEAGLHETDGVRLSPPPDVITKEFTDHGVRYWVRYFIDDYSMREAIDGLARERVWYALRRAAIDIAVPAYDVALHPDDENQRKRKAQKTLARRLRALQRVQFCRVLPDEQQQQLAEAAEIRPYAAGELIIRQGEDGDELFIVLRGHVLVTVDKDEYTPRGDSTEIARLGPGSFFGEMSLVTGEPRAANVRTLVDTELLVVGKAALAPILDAAPDLAEVISRSLATRQQQINDISLSDMDDMMMGDPSADRSSQLLVRIRDFFSLNGRP